MLFLLGGNDLEMQTIKDILKSNNIEYIDKKLSWGAKLSDYKNELKHMGIIYGIELEEDITPPKNYISIDHHGENNHLESSLEQIAKILDLELNRHQFLVAKNDSNYIKGMQSICTTKEEINLIRAMDRKAQGATPEDEALAIKSINLSKVAQFTSLNAG